MSEKGRPYNSEILTPKYWDGHSEKDDCTILDETRSPSSRQIFKAEKKARKSYQAFHAADQQSIQVTYEPDEMFESTRFSEGTIFKYKGFEKLSAGSYINHDYWGVLSSYTNANKNTQPIVIQYPVTATNDPLAVRMSPSLIIPLSIPVGKVMHEKRMTSETLQRIHTVEVWGHKNNEKPPRAKGRRVWTVPSLRSAIKSHGA